MAVYHLAEGPVATSAQREPDVTPAILLEGICKRFGGVEAVKDCTLSIPRGCFVSMLGPSGCGKTTLLRLIAGFERQDSGSIRVHGQLVDGLPPNKRHVNTVFQSYALFPHMSVFDNVAFPLEIARVPKAERKQRVEEMLALVHLEGMGARGASQLSGGQAQRVALARALIGRPEVLLLDEPLAALDLKLRKAMQLELRRIQRELGTTFVFVTHDQGEALAMSDQIILMNGGEVVQVGTAVDLYDRPQSVFASDFIGEANLLEGRVADCRDGELEVAVAGERIVVPLSGEFGIGDEVVVSIRPERLAISANGSAAARHGLSGAVRESVFLGHLVRYMVEISSEATITVEETAPKGEPLPSGTHVQVGFDRDAVRVLPAG